MSTTAKVKGIAVQIQCSTWASDSHGLFDYESRNVFRKTIKCLGLQTDYRVIRSGTNVSFISEADAQDTLKGNTSFITLAKLQWTDGAYHLRSMEGATNSEQIWLIARSVKERQVKINEGDVIKLGRIVMKVKEAASSKDLATSGERWHINVDDDTETVAPEPDLSAGDGDSSPLDRRNMPISTAVTIDADVTNDAVPPPASVVCDRRTTRETISGITMDGHTGDELEDVLTSRPEENNQGGNTVPITSRSTSSVCGPVCRICLSEGGESENPLVSPCKCKGSMQYVHLICLRTWMQGRLNIRNDGTNVSFFWRNLECELCRCPYPHFVSVQQGTMDDSASARLSAIELFEIPRPDFPYLILEPRMSASRGFYVISLNSRRVAKVGRGHDSDIRLHDISVSRLHAQLKYVASSKDSGTFYLEDNKSKFGSLIEVRKPLRLETGCSISVQIGRSVFSLQMKRNWSLLPPCFKSVKSAEDIVVIDHPNPMSIPIIASNTPTETNRAESSPARHAEVDQNDGQLRA